MAAATAKPFGFDDLAAQPAPSDAVYSAADLDAARREARDAAVRDAVAEEAAAQTKLLETVLARLQSSREDFEAALAQQRHALSQAAREIVTKFCQRINAERDVDLALSLLDDYLASTPDQTPAAFVFSDKTNRTKLKKLKSAVSARSADAFLSVATRSDVSPGDCRIEWRSGAMTRELQTALGEIDAIFSNMRGEAAAKRTRKATRS